ncbi:C-type lectin domain-containing protein [Alteribacter keqinensis]|uniref:C-type lectin domain-containing protein n=1 Tax=Alteribacter keqinensis TaxID=2483800 RepID=A0A3M7TRP0_9BACI|nr:C-type lectin domain-containing protein [Alteribacter keqinensis]RNA67700.1 C-type lectin domain-containing protein [Alteribacter keqinensis]
MGIIPFCPRQLQPCEGEQCTERRAEIAVNNFDPVSGLAYLYTPQNISFENASTLCSNQGAFLASINELNQLAHMFTYTDGTGNVQRCPTLFWSTDLSGDPVIVRVMPCSGGNIEVITNFEDCLAHALCVFQ